MWLLQLIQLRLKDVSAPSVTINAQQQLLHQPLQLATNVCRSNWNDNRDCRLELESRIALMVQLIPTLLEYLLMWLLQRIQLRLKNAAGCISAPTSVTKCTTG
jgi:hypothetical protein